MEKRLVLRKLYKYVLQEVNIIVGEELNKEIKKIEKGKRKLTRNWIARRQLLGGSNLLMQELASEDPMEYRQLMRMTPENFTFLLERISDKIQKTDTIMREAIPANIKPQVTLSFFAAGHSLRSLQQFYRVSMSSISSFIPEVLDAICESLSEFFQPRFREMNFRKRLHSVVQTMRII